MKIKVLAQNNKIILFDKTKSPHTKGVLEAILAALNHDKAIISLDDIFGLTCYINPLLNHVGHKSMANIIIPKQRANKETRDYVNCTRELLCEFLYTSEHLNGKLCPYQLIQESESFHSLRNLSDKACMIGLLDSPLKILDNQRLFFEIHNRLKQIIQHEYANKITSNGEQKKEILIQQHLTSESIFYISSKTDNNDSVVDNLILNSIKATDRINSTPPSQQWLELRDIIINEINNYNTMPTVHSDLFLNRCS